MKDNRKPIVETYLTMALMLAEARSSDFFTKVGCVAANDKGEIIGVSYNGTKPGYKFPFDETLAENRDKKNLLYFHAEENLMFRSTRGEIHSIFCSYSPCRNCAKLLAGFGVKNVYYVNEYHREQDFKYIFEQYGVNYECVKI